MAKASSKTIKLDAKDIALLGQAVTAFHTGQPLYATMASMDKLLKIPGGPYVEFSDTMRDPTDPNKIAWRAKDAGMQFFASQPGQAKAQPFGAAPPFGQPSQPQAATSGELVDPAGDGDDDEDEYDPEFELEDGVVIPPLRRGGRGDGKKYPFAAMSIGQSFFIQKTDENPKPSKRIAAVVSTASKNLAPKKFKVQAVVETLPGGATREGARIWRIA